MKNSLEKFQEFELKEADKVTGRSGCSFLSIASGWFGGSYTCEDCQPSAVYANTNFCFTWSGGNITHQYWAATSTASSGLGGGRNAIFN